MLNHLLLKFYMYALIRYCHLIVTSPSERTCCGAQTAPHPSAKEFMTEAYDDGYHDITGVDIVEPVLETMRWEPWEPWAEGGLAVPGQTIAFSGDVLQLSRPACC